MKTSLIVINVIVKAVVHSNLKFHQFHSRPVSTQAQCKRHFLIYRNFAIFTKAKCSIKREEIHNTSPNFCMQETQQFDLTLTPLFSAKNIHSCCRRHARFIPAECKLDFYSVGLHVQNDNKAVYCNVMDFQ